MTTIAAMMTRIAAAAGTIRLRFSNIANNGLSFSDVSRAGAMVPMTGDVNNFVSKGETNSHRLQKHQQTSN